MSTHRIINFEQLASSENRRIALSIIEAGLDAIDTEKVITASMSLDGSRLKIKNKFFDLANFKKIIVIGFGKAASKAATALEKILKEKISDGIVISTAEAEYARIKGFVGTHPMPSSHNVTASKEIVELAESLGKDDLAIVIVSGGGSALLCWPNEECEQGQKLYQDFLKTSGTIKELNTVRKHLSELKGGGLAKLLYPAKTIGLIFSDVPGDSYDEVASGPTYIDNTSAKDATAILNKYGLKGYTLLDTPRDKKFFEKVDNIPIVSNTYALAAMAKKAVEFGLTASIISNSLYETPPNAIGLIFSTAAENHAVLTGGETKLQVTKDSGSGGRNQFLAMQALLNIKPGQVFISFASDGRDNGPAAGAIVDEKTLAKIKELRLDVNDYMNRFDAFNFFEKLKDLILTGSTGANVSDLVLLLNK